MSGEKGLKRKPISSATLKAIYPTCETHPKQLTSFHAAPCLDLDPCEPRDLPDPWGVGSCGLQGGTHSLSRSCQSLSVSHYTRKRKSQA